MLDAIGNLRYQRSILLDHVFIVAEIHPDVYAVGRLDVSEGELERGLGPNSTCTKHLVADTGLLYLADDLTSYRRVFRVELVTFSIMQASAIVETYDMEVRSQTLFICP
jgi:hypothetical protein